MPTVLLLNGPNLNLLGTREPEIYGSTTLTEIEEQVSASLRERNIECETFQSNSEGEIIDWLHLHREADFLLLNPGALTHTSVGLRDAVLGVEIPFWKSTFPMFISVKSFDIVPIFQILRLGH